MEPFWKSKTLQEMATHEWEALCDGCANCCLEKEENLFTGKIRVFSVCCEHLDLKTCRCTIYQKRGEMNTKCLILSPDTILRIPWLPRTCAYRLLAEGRGLEWWHPLVSGSTDTVHEAGVSIKRRAVSGKFVHPEDLR